MFSQSKNRITAMKIQEKKKELAEIQKMMDLVKHYIKLKEIEELEKKEPRSFKFVVNLNPDDSSILPSISLTQVYPSAKFKSTCWADIEDDDSFFDTLPILK